MRVVKSLNCALFQSFFCHQRTKRAALPAGPHWNVKPELPRQAQANLGALRAMRVNIPHCYSLPFVLNEPKGPRCPQGPIGTTSPTIPVKSDNPRQVRQSPSCPTFPSCPTYHAKPRKAIPRQARPPTLSRTTNVMPDHQRHARQSPSIPTIHVKPDHHPGTSSFPSPSPTGKGSESADRPREQPQRHATSKAAPSSRHS